MVASQAAMEQSRTGGTPAEIVLEMAASMEASAEHGEWDRVEEIAQRLRSAVMQVPEADRRGSLLAAQRSTEKVQALADSARHDVTGKLSDIRRGRDAAKAYGSAY